MFARGLQRVVDLETHPLADADFVAQCRSQLESGEALLLGGFLRPEVIAELVSEAERQEHLAFCSEQTSALRTVYYYDNSHELGWHFDNSSFSVTLLLQGADGGGIFEFVPDMRDTSRGLQNERGVAAQMDGNGVGELCQLGQSAGDLVLFRGRDALHRVTPVEGDRMRLLVVLAYNTEPGLSLSENARMTFFGRLV